MKRLLRVSFDLALLSFIPVMSWFILGLLINKNLINVFTLTYPIQFVWLIFKNIFSTGANITKEKENNSNSVMSGILLGTVIATILFGLLIFNIDKYITYMQLDITTYKNFAIYSILSLYIQLIFTFYIEKLYYENKYKLANKYSFTFNLLHFFVLLISSLIFKNHFMIIIITLISILTFTLIVICRESNKFHLEFNLKNYIRYDSVEIFNNLAFFFIYFIGLNNAFSFGESYATAITFITLVTDTQWDTFEAISVLAKIDISRNEFNYKKHIKNSYILSLLLLGSTIIMFLFLVPYYNLNLKIVSIFLILEIINMLLYPSYLLKTCYLQLEYSAIKTTVNKLISNVNRLAISFWKNPFCTSLGQLFSSMYQLITTRYLFDKHFELNEDGTITKIT